MWGIVEIVQGKLGDVESQKKLGLLDILEGLKCDNLTFWNNDDFEIWNLYISLSFCVLFEHINESMWMFGEI